MHKRAFPFSLIVEINLISFQANKQSELFQSSFSNYHKNPIFEVWNPSQFWADQFGSRPWD